MASTTGDGAEQAGPKAAATAPRGAPPDPSAQDAVPTPSAGFGPPLAVAEPKIEAAPAKEGVPILAIPPVAVPKVRAGAPSTRSIKGETTASDYVAPRELPAHTPRPTESVDAKVVIDVPDASAGAAESEAEVVEMRQRRRAPTMKIDRSKVDALKKIEGARERSTEPDLPAMPSGVLPSPRDESLRPASVGIDAHRPLARARPEPRSARGVGWAVVALATVVVGGGVAAIALGLVPGLGPSPQAEGVGPASRPTTHTTAQPAAEPEPAPAEPAAPAPSVVPTVEASTAPAASAAPAPSATTPYKPPFQSPSQPARPAQPYPRPRPKSDIPNGI